MFGLAGVDNRAAVSEKKKKNRDSVSGEPAHVRLNESSKGRICVNLRRKYK